MESRTVEFKGAFGDALSAKLDIAEGKVKAYALFAHCFTCSKNLKAVSHITKSLANRGISTLRFDFTGLGQSDGDFANTNFSSNVDDLVAAGSKDKISTLNRALLIMHTPIDRTVGVDNAAKLYTYAKHPKSFISLHEADHLLTNPIFSRYAGNMIAQWSDVYLTNN